MGSQVRHNLVTKPTNQQYMKRKTKTEIDTLNGKVIDLGEKYGVDVKTNKIIYDLIKAIESDFSD